MKRNILKSLLAWKNSSKRKPLVCRGARQVGKTYLIKEFGKNHFEQSLTINFEKEFELKKLFASMDPKKIINELSIIKSIDIKPGSFLLFLDEIQTCPEALKCLRYFYEDFPKLNVIAAGSLLDIVLSNENISMPVGRIEYLYIYPLSFIEFLDALNKSKLKSFIQNLKKGQQIPELIDQELNQLIKQYFIVGGMPEVAADYAEHGERKVLQMLK